jgi:hypothetical protein
VHVPYSHFMTYEMSSILILNMLMQQILRQE